MINLSNDIKPISYVKSHTAEILKQVENSKNPVVITQNGEAKAVLVDVESYQNIIDSINLLKIISIGEDDIENGRIETHENVKNKINKLFE
jgi:prevent-host-death family protein